MNQIDHSRQRALPGATPHWASPRTWLEDEGWNSGASQTRKVERLTKTLELTPEQQAKIQPIFDQAKPQVTAVRQEAMQKIKAIRENTQAQIRPILTPAQQQKFDALKKAREDMRKAREEMRDAMKQ